MQEARHHEEHPAEEYPDYTVPEDHPETAPPNEPAWAGTVILLGVISILIAGFIFMIMYGWVPVER